MPQCSHHPERCFVNVLIDVGQGLEPEAFWPFDRAHADAREPGVGHLVTEFSRGVEVSTRETAPIGRDPVFQQGDPLGGIGGWNGPAGRDRRQTGQSWNSCCEDPATCPHDSGGLPQGHDPVLASREVVERAEQQGGVERVIFELQPARISDRGVEGPDPRGLGDLGRHRIDQHDVMAERCECRGVHARSPADVEDARIRAGMRARISSWVRSNFSRPWAERTVSRAASTKSSE